MTNAPSVEVMQADRECAATFVGSVWRELKKDALEQFCRDGHLDGADFVQAVARHRTKATRPLTAEIADLRAQLDEALEALERQGDNMAFVLNHMTVPEQWYQKFTDELESDRAILAKRKQP